MRYLALAAYSVPGIGSSVEDGEWTDCIACILETIADIGERSREFASEMDQVLLRSKWEPAPILLGRPGQSERPLLIRPLDIQTPSPEVTSAGNSCGISPPPGASPAIALTETDHAR
jgi:hypothetical protein